MKKFKWFLFASLLAAVIVFPTILMEAQVDPTHYGEWMDEDFDCCLTGNDCAVILPKSDQ